MIRSTCAALFAFMLAMAFVASPQSSEAKDRRCCPQPTCCQPRATCCQPAPTCCQSTPHSRVGLADVQDTVCPQFLWAQWDGYCSYLAVRCGQLETLNLDGPCDLACPSMCPSDPDCQTVNFPGEIGLFRVGNTKKGKNAFSNKEPKRPFLEGKQPENVTISNPPPTANVMTPGTLWSRELVGQPKNVKFKRTATSARWVYAKLFHYRVSGMDGSGAATGLQDVFVGVEIQTPANPGVPAIQVERADNHVAWYEEHAIGGVVNQYQIITNSDLTRD